MNAVYRPTLQGTSKGVHTFLAGLAKKIGGCHCLFPLNRNLSELKAKTVLFTCRIQRNLKKQEDGSCLVQPRQRSQMPKYKPQRVYGGLAPMYKDRRARPGYYLRDRETGHNSGTRQDIRTLMGGISSNRHCQSL